MTATELVKRVAQAGHDAFETRDITRLDGVVDFALKEAAKLDKPAGSNTPPAPPAPPAKTSAVAGGPAKGRGW